MTFLRFPFKSNKISIKKGKVRGFWREYRKAARRFDAKDSDRLIHKIDSRDLFFVSFILCAYICFFKTMATVTATSVLQAGNTAVITGASSGIGRAMALFCASKGMNVWMVDIDSEELETAKQMALGKRSSGEITSKRIDVSDCKAM